MSGGPVATPGDGLAQGMLDAVRAQDFGATPDRALGGAPIAHFPSLDLALIDFTPGRAPRWANVLFSREHPDGVVAAIDARAHAVRDIRFDADLVDADGVSIAWRPDADWSKLPWQTLSGDGPMRFVAPYPASLLKLMVAVALGMAIDEGLLADWPAAAAPMIEISDNDATTELVALLHRLGMIGPLHARLAALDLHTLRLADTRADGGWGNGAGSGVGHIQMTAWDTARLLWLLDAEAPPPPWLAPGTTLLQPATREHLRALLRGQQHDHVLSSGSLREVPGWVPGWPDAPAFAHKTGNTENYASDAGILRVGSTHAIVALFTSLGDRYAPDPRCATTWRVPALGAALFRLLHSPR